MYEPTINSLLVEIIEDKWAPGNDESMLGRSYREGTLVKIGPLYNTKDYPIDNEPALDDLMHTLTNLLGNKIMWNEGTESGTIFDGEDGKKYGFIYWWDVRGVAPKAGNK